jgi:hypothetical protein
MLRHGASSMAGGAQPTYSVAIQQAEDADPVTAAEQMAAQEDDPFSRMGIFLVAGGEISHLSIPFSKAFVPSLSWLAQPVVQQKNTVHAAM